MWNSKGLWRSPGRSCVVSSSIWFVLICMYVGPGPSSPYKRLCSRSAISRNAEGKSGFCGWVSFFSLATVDQSALSVRVDLFQLIYYFFHILVRLFPATEKRHEPSPRRTRWRTKRVPRTGFQSQLFVLATGNVQRTLSALSVYPIHFHICIYMYISSLSKDVLSLLLNGESHYSNKKQIHSARPMVGDLINRARMAAIELPNGIRSTERLRVKHKAQQFDQQCDGHLWIFEGVDYWKRRRKLFEYWYNTSVVVSVVYLTYTHTKVSCKYLVLQAIYYTKTFARHIADEFRNDIKSVCSNICKFTHVTAASTALQRDISSVCYDSDGLTYESSEEQNSTTRLLSNFNVLFT